MGSNGSYDPETGRTLRKFEWEYTGSTLCGIEIIKKKNDKESISLPPKSATPGSAYVMLDKDGNFKHYAEYGENQKMKLRLDYGMHGGKKSFHVHEYDENGRETTTVIASNEEGIIDEKLYNKYKKFLKGLDL
ncbi:MAG: polymorphic toxin type 24 domain-containing protein [Candidatus Saccharibacteria bacterium]|nr:polymorphic toxin type 24 domain-containing protein [Candidatus Saccharibacteria bacterium]